MSKKIKVTLLILALVVLGGLLYYWYITPGTVLGDQDETEANTSQSELAKKPRLMITSPEAGRILYNPNVQVNYRVIGNISEVLNIDIILTKEGGVSRHYVASFDKMTKEGQYPLMNLEEGNYSLALRLRDLKGSVSSLGSYATSSFTIKGDSNEE